MACELFLNPAVLLLTALVLWIITRKMDGVIETLSVKYDSDMFELIRSNRENQKNWFSEYDSMDRFLGVPRYILSKPYNSLSWFHYSVGLYLLTIYIAIPTCIILLLIYC
jgi:hypothetical protein